MDAPLGLLRKTRDCDTSINKVIKNQEKFKSDLSEIVRRKWKYESEEQQSVINNVKKFL